MKHLHRFSKQYHINKSSDFDRLFSQGQRCVCKYLLGFYQSNGLGYFRLGMSIGKKFGHAYERNQWKRLIRESFRISPLRYQQGVDLIVVPSKHFKTLEWDAIQKDMQQLLMRITKSMKAIAIPPSPPVRSLPSTLTVAPPSTIELMPPVVSSSPPPPPLSPPPSA